MKPDNQLPDKAKYDYNSLFIVAILPMATSQGVESIQTPLEVLFGAWRSGCRLRAV